MIDIMTKLQNAEVKCLDYGFVRLVDCMPRLVTDGQTADQAIVQAARVSYGEGTKSVSDDRGLIRYLVRNRHTTPLEMCVFKFHMSMPIFVARQIVRHRMVSMNEVSARYSVLPNKFFKPPIDDIRQQSKTNRQGRDEMVAEGTAEEFLTWLDRAEETYKEYESFLEKGIARELARISLPLSIYTEFYWKIDLHNLFHFLSLRMDKHAQKETREYAVGIYSLVKQIVPVACEAFEDYSLHAVTLSQLEIAAIRNGFAPLDTTNKREASEWEEKRKLFLPSSTVESHDPGY